ncbi:MAG TPA: EAL domain-containing protein [Catenuloplanes sp.]
MARAAVAGLALGLAALAVLALIGTARTSETTAWVRAADQVAENWSKTFLLLSIEDEALTNYVIADRTTGREPLLSAVGSAGPSLDWLAAHGSVEDRAQAHSAQEIYRSYTEMLADFAEQGATLQRAEAGLQAEQIGLVASALQKQAVAQMTRQRLTTYAYLTDMEIRTRKLRVAAVAIGVVDLLLLGLSSMVLLSHQRRTERQAGRDSLTGLANRVRLAGRMEQAMRTADRYGEPVGLLLLDLNKFKEINDTLGHHAGDLLLQHVASRLSGVVRDGDTVARLGGDEFAVLLHRVGSVVHLAEVAGRVLAALQVPADLDGVTVDVRASVGAALYPGQSANAAELMQHADAAMYAAKRGGLGTAIYGPATVRSHVSEPGPLGELRRALDARELVLHYQPKARTDNARVCGVEALVRWQHPVRGLLPPVEFIPLAESSDLIHPLTDYVLAAALRQHREWRADGLVLPVAVNITAHSVLDVGFPDRVRALLAEHGTPAGQLTLELTETTAITNSDQATAVLGALRDAGVRLSVDDFGAGYSSMAYLHNWPLDELKIDRQFIMSVRSSPSNAAIVRAILELARALDLAVVAEGVEDRSTLETLAEMGCAVAQGYYLCRPMPARALREWLAGQPPPVHHADVLAALHS